MPKGISKHNQSGWYHTEQTRKKIRKKTKGENNPFYGKTHTKKVRENLRKYNKKFRIKPPSRKGQKNSEKWKEKMRKIMKGRISPMKGKHQKEKAKQKISKALSGSKSYLWKGGISFEPYGLEFNEDLKEVIRNRDRRKCQISGKTELELGYKLSIHHIDYDKKNNDPKNLISLSKKWHGKTNSNRDYWIDYFNQFHFQV